MRSTGLLLLSLNVAVFIGCADPADPEDAGSSTADAAARDAGGELDASVGDAGDPDAGASDAGGSDAGLLDAGPPIDPLAGIGAVESVQGGFAFLEGPRWREADGVLLFTDIPRATIHRLTPPASIDVFRMPSGEANGLATLPDGRLLAAEHGNRRVSVTETDGSVVDFAATDASGDTFNSPNDIAVRSDGTVYFTDPPYGLAGRPREIAFNGVFRVAPSGDVSVVWMSASESQRPNGVGLSPDERTLYVADTADGAVRSFDVMADGSTSGERMLITDTPGADGMAIDVAGNLFVTTSEGVKVYAPDGSSWGTISVPQAPANCAFGDADHRTLYITARTELYRVRLASPGRI